MTKFKISFWQKLQDGTSEYLARHYWWTYLWRPAIWFFAGLGLGEGMQKNHQHGLINQYKSLVLVPFFYIYLVARPNGEFLRALECCYWW